MAGIDGWVDPIITRLRGSEPAEAGVIGPAPIGPNGPIEDSQGEADEVNADTLRQCAENLERGRLALQHIIRKHLDLYVRQLHRIASDARSCGMTARQIADQVQDVAFQIDRDAQTIRTISG